MGEKRIKKKMISKVESEQTMKKKEDKKETNSVIKKDNISILKE